VTKFEGYDEDSKQWREIWSRAITQPSSVEKSQIFSPRFSVTTYKTDHIRMEMDCRLAPSWVEIDAVRMRGRTCYWWDFSQHAKFPYSFRKQVVEFWVACRLQSKKSFALPLEIFTLIVQTLGVLYDEVGNTFPVTLHEKKEGKAGKQKTPKKKHENEGMCTQS
jgi:hypothetical protein